MSQEPSGAVDNSYDDGERSAREILADNIVDYPHEIRPGDVVIDQVKQRPLYVRRKVANTAFEYFDNQDFDLTTYNAHPFLPITPDDTIFECVFLPTTVEGLPSEQGDGNTYDYPAGRLARVPVEWLYDSGTHRFENMQNAAVAALIGTAANADLPDDLQDAPAATVVRAVAEVAFGSDAAKDASERAGVDWTEDEDLPDFEDFD